MKRGIDWITKYKKEIGGLLRHVTTIAGGVLIAKGSLSMDTFTMILGSASSIVGTGWSFVSKAAHKKEIHVALSTDPVTGEQTRAFNPETKTWDAA